MFIINLGSLERRRNTLALTSKVRFKNPKIHELRYVQELKTHASPLPVSLFLVDLDKNYRNEVEMDKK